ncbi:MAG: regulatory iron-sulfur-containing complex subunit RicT [bacterium]
MPEVVGITVRKMKELMYFKPQGIDLGIGDLCLVETENDLELGTVAEETKIVNEIQADIKKVSRKLTSDDMRQLKENSQKEMDAYKVCLRKIEDKELDMKLVSVSYTFNCNKLFIYYTAPERVDFRELVKDLAYLLKTRIEMCQIGVRDEAKICGGFGLCGRSLCCVSFLKEFKPVTIEMAKEQELSLSSSKISGLCGRLMCCLGYEHAGYCEMRKGLPHIEDKVNIKEGNGKVVSVNVLKREVFILMEEGGLQKCAAEDIIKIHESKYKRKKQKSQNNQKDHR